MKLSLVMAALLAAPAAAQQSELLEWQIHEDSWQMEREALESPQYSWTSLASNTFNRSRPGGNWVGQKFYLIGGELLSSTWGISRADQVEIFDAATLSWSTSASSMPFPCSNIMGSTAVAGTKIYVFGGYDSAATYLDTVQIYDTATDTWSVSAATLPAGGLLGTLACNIGGSRILVCGGGNSSGLAVSDAYIFDATTETFSAAASMPSARRYITGQHSNGNVAACGGFGTGTIVETYNVASDSWTVNTPMASDRAGCGVVMVGNLAVMVGGNWSGYLADAEVLNVVTDTYFPAVAASLGSMAQGRRAFAYGLYQRGTRRAMMAADGYAGFFVGSVEGLL